MVSEGAGEIKGREVEMGSHSWMDYNCLAAELFLNSCFGDTVFKSVTGGAAFRESRRGQGQGGGAGLS